MTHPIDRRSLLLVAGAAILAAPRARAAGERKRIALDLVPREMPAPGGQKAIAAAGFMPAAPLRFSQGDAIDLILNNRLPQPAMLYIRGLDGAPTLEPILARQPVPPGGNATYPLALTHAGTLLLDARFGGGDLPLPVLPLVVTEREAVATRDEVLLIEDWRTNANAQPFYTLNGAASSSLRAQAGERLRLRFINGAQRSVLAVQLPGLEVRVIAIDGQPSEIFSARESRLVMAPGTRIDAIVDVPVGGPFAIEINNGERTVKASEITVSGTAGSAPGELKPLPSNGLPDRLQLQSALRVDVPLDGSDSAVNAPPLFRVKRGRSVVLTLKNTADSAVIVHLHGHHMRLLDRLDDGWKPFWLDTVAVPAKQTVRVAFSATNAGAYLLQSANATWGSPARLRSYVVEI